MADVSLAMGAGNGGAHAWKSSALGLINVIHCANGHATHQNAIRIVPQYAISQCAPHAVRASTQIVVKCNVASRRVGWFAPNTSALGKTAQHARQSVANRHAKWYAAMISSLAAMYAPNQCVSGNAKTRRLVQSLSAL